MSSAADAIIEPATRTAATLSDREQTLLAALRASNGRVVTRSALARAAGLHRAPRRVDVHLVTVRRHLGDDQLVNVRGRGWMLNPSVDSVHSAG